MFSPIDRFFAVFRWTLPIYGALHIVPMLLFKRKAVVSTPTPMVLRASWGTMRSAAFLGVFVAIYQGALQLSSSSLFTAVLPLLMREPLIKVTSAPRKMHIALLLDGRASRRGCSLHSSPSRHSGWVACSQDCLYLLKQNIVAENLRCTFCQRASRVRGLRRAGKGSFFGLGSTGAHWWVVIVVLCGCLGNNIDTSRLAPS
jgi:hypothetical protein